MKQRVFLRFAAVGFSLLLVGAVAVETVDKLLIEPRTVSSWGELVQDYLVYRQQWGPMAPPVSYSDALADINSGNWSFLAKDWAFKSTDGTYYVPKASKLAKLKFPLVVRVYEDIQRGEIIVLSSADGRVFKGEALFDAPEFLPYEAGFPLNRYAFDELAPRRIVYEVILKPEADASTDLLNVRQAEQSEIINLQSEMSMMLLVPEERTNDLWLGTEVVSNSLNLWVYAPSGVTNVEIYTSADLVSNVWTVADILSMTATNLVSWAVSTNETTAFFRTGNAGQDSDTDGICDARELVVHKTDPTEEDSDSDTISDYQELYTDYTDPNNDDISPPEVVIHKPFELFVLTP